MSTDITFSIPDAAPCRDLVIHAQAWCDKNYPGESDKPLRYRQVRPGLCEMVLASPQHEEAYYRLLWCLTAINLWILRSCPGFWPGLYNTPIKYAPDPKGVELWGSLLTLLLEGEGDCEDLAMARLAEELEQGVEAVPWLSNQAGEKCDLLLNGDRECHPARFFHVRLFYPTRGTVEDPSARLGMFQSLSG